MPDWFWVIFNYVFLPGTTAQVTVYYLIWMGAFIFINTIWDICTKKTDPFHLAKMKDKTNVVYNASTFCSSLLIITAFLSPTVQQIAKDTTLPLLIAGVSGLLRSIPALCPYDPTPPGAANSPSNPGLPDVLK